MARPKRNKRLRSISNDDDCDCEVESDHRRRMKTCKKKKKMSRQEENIEKIRKKRYAYQASIPNPTDDDEDEVDDKGKEPYPDEENKKSREEEEEDPDDPTWDPEGEDIEFVIPQSQCGPGPSYSFSLSSSKWSPVTACNHKRGAKEVHEFTEARKAAESAEIPSDHAVSEATIAGNDRATSDSGPEESQTQPVAATTAPVTSRHSSASNEPAPTDDLISYLKSVKFALSHTPPSLPVRSSNTSRPTKAEKKQPALVDADDIVTSSYIESKSLDDATLVMFGGKFRRAIAARRHCPDKNEELNLEAEEDPELESEEIEKEQKLMKKLKQPDLMRMEGAVNDQCISEAMTHPCEEGGDDKTKLAVNNCPFVLYSVALNEGMEHDKNKGIDDEDVESFVNDPGVSYSFVNGKTQCHVYQDGMDDPEELVVAFGHEEDSGTEDEYLQYSDYDDPYLEFDSDEQSDASQSTTGDDDETGNQDTDSLSPPHFVAEDKSHGDACFPERSSSLGVPVLLDGIEIKVRLEHLTGCREEVRSGIA